MYSDAKNMPSAPLTNQLTLAKFSRVAQSGPWNQGQKTTNLGKYAGAVVDVHFTNIRWDIDEDFQGDPLPADYYVFDIKIDKEDNLNRIIDVAGERMSEEVGFCNQRSDAEVVIDGKRAQILIEAVRKPTLRLVADAHKLGIRVAQSGPWNQVKKSRDKRCEYYWCNNDFHDDSPRNDQKYCSGHCYNIDHDQPCAQDCEACADESNFQYDNRAPRQAQAGPWSGQKKPKPLPELCYIRILTGTPGNRIGIVKRGESGYYHSDYDTPQMTPNQVDELIKQLNTKLGVSDAEQMAMESGSMFGWDNKMASAETYRNLPRRAQSGLWNKAGIEPVQHITTDDGYNFYVLTNGRVVDNRNPQRVDIWWPSLESFKRQMRLDNMPYRIGNFKAVIKTSDLLKTFRGGQAGQWNAGVKDRQQQEAITLATKRFEDAVDSGRITDQQSADEISTEIAIDVASEFGFLAENNPLFEAICSAMMEKAGKEFPGDWGEGVRQAQSGPWSKPTKNTRLFYMYRDGGNFKTFAEDVVIRGVITPQDIKPHCDDGKYFIAYQVGLPEQRPEVQDENDHVYHEFLNDPCMMLTDEPPTPGLLSAQVLKQNFKKITKQGGWNIAEAIAHLGVPE